MRDSRDEARGAMRRSILVIAQDLMVLSEFERSTLLNNEGDQS